MPRRAASGTKGLIKRHHGCKTPERPTSCDCEWSGRYQAQEVVLSKWANRKIDPRTKGEAIKVLNRFFLAVDTETFDPAGERPVSSAADTLKTFITEYKTHYVEEHGLTSTSLDGMLNVLAEGQLGSYSLKQLAGSSQDIERWLNTTGKTKDWANKTWNEYRGLLFRVLKQATRWKVGGKPRLASNPVAEIDLRVAYQPEHFKQRHLEEPIEDRLFAVVEQLNRPVYRATNSKLTLEQATAIRGKLALGQTGVALAAEYDVSPAVISSIKHGDIWNPSAAVSTKGTEMKRRLIAAFDGGLRVAEMQRMQLCHVNWRPVLLERQDGPPVECYVITLPPEITKGGKTTGKPEEVYAATARFRHVLEARRFALRANPARRQFIFGAEDGREQQSFDKQWHALFQLAGIDYGRNLGVTWHTIRHEFISRLAELTKDPVLTQKLARHKQLETTQGYFHTRRDRELAAVASLDRAVRTGS